MVVEEAREVVHIDPNDLTFGELEELEDLTGVTLTDLSKEGVKAKVITVLTWFALRKKEPETTLDDVRAMDMSSVNFGDAKEE